MTNLERLLCVLLNNNAGEANKMLPEFYFFVENVRIDFKTQKLYMKFNNFKVESVFDLIGILESFCESQENNTVINELYGAMLAKRFGYKELEKNSPVVVQTDMIEKEEYGKKYNFFKESKPETKTKVVSNSEELRNAFSELFSLFDLKVE